MTENYDALGFYSVIVVDSMPRVATYHAHNWDDPDRTKFDYTKCGIGPVSEYLHHSFALLDPARVRPCKRCYGVTEETPK